MRNIILMLLMLCMIKINAQEKSILNPGTTFFLPSVTAKELWGNFSPGSQFDWHYSVVLISEQKSCVEIFGRDSTFVVQLEPFSAKEVEIPVNYLIQDSIQNNGVRIESDKPINVYSSNSLIRDFGERHRFSFLALNESWSENFNTIFPYNFGLEKSIPNTNASYDRFIISFEIVSLSDNNILEICFKGEVRKSIDCFSSPFTNTQLCNLIFPSDTCILLELQKEERIAYTMGDKLENQTVKELRKSTINTLNQKPFSVFSRARSSPNNLINCPPNAFRFLNYNLIYNLPMDFWSSKYYIPPRPEFPYFDLTAFSPDTLEYTLNGTPVKSDIIDTAFLPQDMVVIANNSFSLVTGTGARSCPTMKNQNERNFMSYQMVGAEHYYHRTCFAPFSHLDTIYNHYVVSLVVPTSGINGVRHNGTTLNASLFTPFSADSTYSWANIEVDTGYQCIESDSAFLGILYSWYRDSTYNLPLNQRNHYRAIAHLLGATPHHIPDSTDQSFYIGFQNQKVRFEDYDTQDELCPNDTVWFYPPPAANTTWVFDFSSGESLTLQTQNNMRDSLPFVFEASGYFTISISDALDCKDGDLITVFVREPLELDLDIELTQECEAYFLEMGINNYEVDSVQWILPDNTKLYQLEDQASIPLSPLPIRLQVKAWAYGCKQEEEIIIEEVTRIDGLDYIPNVFTPNGDGRNDCWKTGHTDAIRECYELFIFNRWGQILYHTIDADDCWDGTTEEGKEASDGVYFYHLQIGTKIHKGSLQLMR